LTGAGRVRFLDPHRPKGEDLGSAFPILPPTALSPVPLIDMDLSKVGSFRFMVDSGFWNVVDVTLTPALMRKASQNKLVTATSLFVGFVIIVAMFFAVKSVLFAPAKKAKPSRAH